MLRLCIICTQTPLWFYDYEDASMAQQPILHRCNNDKCMDTAFVQQGQTPWFVLDFLVRNLGSRQKGEKPMPAATLFIFGTTTLPCNKVSAES